MHQQQHGMNTFQAYTLYTCHALSAWQARSYEFAAVLFTAAAYPGSLRPAAFIGISSSLTTILFGSALGRWIDHGSSRLRTLCTTIKVNRLTIILACLVWFLIVSDATASAESKTARTDADAEGSSKGPASGGIDVLKTVAFCFLLALGIVEGLARKANVISIERDWVPVLAPPAMTEGYTLARVNATMARIDMVCKVIAPIAMSWFLSMVSMKWGVVAVCAINIFSWFLEIFTARKVAESCPVLSEQRHRDATEPSTTSSTGSEACASITSHLRLWWPNYVDGFKIYFRSDVWKPSLAYCITHASILSVSSITIVFLLDSGYSLQLVTLGQTLSALFELSSTFVTPIAVQRAAETSGVSRTAVRKLTADDEIEENNLPDEDDVTAVADRVNNAVMTVGLFGVLFLLFVLLPTIPILEDLTWHLPYPIARSDSSPTLSSRPLESVVLFFCLAASRLGRGTLVLSTQQLAQSRVPGHQRSSFAGTELIFESTFGLLHSLGAAIWSKPEQFGRLGLGSITALVVSALLYCRWVVSERGGLLGRSGSRAVELRERYMALNQDAEESLEST